MGNNGSESKRADKKNKRRFHSMDGLEGEGGGRDAEDNKVIIARQRQTKTPITKECTVGAYENNYNPIYQRKSRWCGEWDDWGEARHNSKWKKNKLVIF